MLFTGSASTIQADTLMQRFLKVEAEMSHYLLNCTEIQQKSLSLFDKQWVHPIKVEGYRILANLKTAEKFFKSFPGG